MTRRDDARLGYCDGYIVRRPQIEALRLFAAGEPPLISFPLTGRGYYVIDAVPVWKATIAALLRRGWLAGEDKAWYITERGLAVLREFERRMDAKD